MRDVTDLHYACEADWTCHGCGRDICARCEPSPAEETLCADCFYIDDPNGDAA